MSTPALDRGGASSSAPTAPAAKPRLPAVLDLPRAAAMLGIGRTTAYKLVQQDRWPTPILRIGRLIKVPTRPLLDLLSGNPAQGVASQAGAPDGTAVGHRR
jgi:hypothetical protein